MIVPLLLAAALAAPAPRTADLTGTNVYVQRDPGAQLVGVQLAVSAGTARQAANQNGLAALSAETILQTKIDGASVADRALAAGGSVVSVVGPDVVRFSIEAMPAALPSISRDLAQAIASPDVSPPTLAAARAALTDRLVDEERNPLAVGVEMLRGSYYRGSAALPALGTRATLPGFGPADVTGFITAHYRRGNTFVTALGDIDDAGNAAVNALLAALPAGSEAPASVTVRPFPAHNKRIVTQRDIGVPFVLLGFAAPALGDRDFASMLVLRAVLGDVATRPSAATLSVIERGVDVLYNYDTKPGSLTVAVNGSQLDPTTGVTIVQTILKTASSRALARDVLSRYKQLARGQWQLEATSLSDRGAQISVAVAHGADPGTAQLVPAAIDRVTSADVQRIAKMYLQRYTMALVLPRRK